MSGTDGGDDPNCDQTDVIALLKATLAEEDGRSETDVQRIDTHGAVVLLGRDRVFKLKRSVCFPYMDLSTVERRAQVCRAELRLNRRTAPDIYLGLGAIVLEPDGSLAVHESSSEDGPDVPSERVRDWVVIMARFDETCLLSSMAESGSLEGDLLDGLADRIADFHGRELPAADRQADAMATVVEGNLTELAQSPFFDHHLTATLASETRSWMRRLSPLLDRRAKAGRVRHCHGDLHLKNVVVIDGQPFLFDALEFDDSLATIDVFYDLAFLLMDLEFRGLRGAANRVLNRYYDCEPDASGLAALPLFLSARSSIRAKVGASAAAEHQRGGHQDGEEKAAAALAQARAYLAMALDVLRPEPARLVAVGGLSGTGKTSVSMALAPHLGAVPGAIVLRTDVIRKQLAGVSPRWRLDASYYSAEWSERVYRTMAERAGEILEAGHSVVCDAVSAQPWERKLLAAVAETAGVGFDGIWLEADPELLRQRVAARHGDASDADVAVVDHQLDYDLGALTWHRISSEGAPDEVVARVADRLLRGT